MDINIRMKDCKFFVNEENRTVVCKINGTKTLAEQFINGNTNLCTYLMDIDLDMPPSFTGKAVCSSDDEWDIDLGKQIAFARAKHKFNSCFFKRMQAFINEFDFQMGQLVTKINNYGKILQDGSDRRLAAIQAKCPGFTRQEIRL